MRKLILVLFVFNEVFLFNLNMNKIFDKDFEYKEFD